VFCQMLWLTMLSHFFFIFLLIHTMVLCFLLLVSLVRGQGIYFHVPHCLKIIVKRHMNCKEISLAVLKASSGKFLGGCQDIYMHCMCMERISIT